MGKKITFSSEARKGALRGVTQHSLLVATAWVGTSVSLQKRKKAEFAGQ